MSDSADHGGFLLFQTEFPLEPFCIFIFVVVVFSFITTTKQKIPSSISSYLRRHCQLDK